MVYLISFPQVDAMKIGVKEFKKEYKNVNIDKIEVCHFPLLKMLQCITRQCLPVSIK